MKKKNKAFSNLIVFPALPVIFGIVSCGPTTPQENNKEISFEEYITNNVNTSSKTELAFQSKKINKDFPIENVKELKKRLGIEIDAPKKATFKVWKEQFTNDVTFSITENNEEVTKTITISNFDNETNFEKEIKEIGAEFNEMNQAFHNKYIFSTFEFEDETEVTSRVISDKFAKLFTWDTLKKSYTDNLDAKYNFAFDADAEKGEQFVPVPLNLAKKLDDLKAYKKIKVIKEFEKKELTFIFYVQEDEFSEDVYAQKIVVPINHFGKVHVDKIQNILKDVYAMNAAKGKGHISSLYSTIDFKKREYKAVNPLNYKDAEKKDTLRLVFSPTFKEVINDYKLDVSFLKDINTTDLKILIKNGAKTTVNQLAPIVGKFNIVKPGGNLEPTGMTINKDKKYIYILGKGGKINILNLSNGLAPKGWAGIVTLKNYAADGIPYSPSWGTWNPYFLYIGGAADSKDSFATLLKMDRFFTGNDKDQKFISIPKDSSDQNLIYNTRFALPGENQKMFFILNKNKNNGFVEYLASSDAVSNFKQLEIYDKDIVDAMTYDSDLENGYLFASTGVTPKTNEPISQILHFGKNMKFQESINNLPDSKLWVVEDLGWQIRHMYRDEVSGYWLTGINGRLAHINELGEIQIIFDDKHNDGVIHSLINDEEGNLIVSYENGVVRHFVVDRETYTLTETQKDTIFKEQTIDFMFKDKDKNIYLLGQDTNNSNYAIVEKLTPDGTGDSWEE